MRRISALSAVSTDLVVGRRTLGLGKGISRKTTGAVERAGELLRRVNKGRAIQTAIGNSPLVAGSWAKLSAPLRSVILEVPEPSTHGKEGAGGRGGDKAPQGKGAFQQQFVTSRP